MRIAICWVVVVMPSMALAEHRPATRSMSCASARALVDRQGAVILSTGPVTYDRYVASRAFCTVSETLESTFVTSQDKPQCFVGYRCREVRADEPK
jgi:hypothetical protein